MATKARRPRRADDGEVELAKLQRQYRAAEGDRKTYVEETQATLRKQKATIEKLEKDNKHLKEEVAMAEGSAALLKKKGERAKELEARIAGYKAEIDTEKDRCGELDKMILQANRELREARKALVAGAATGDTPAAQRRIHTMENRVEKANRRLNTTLVDNGKRREEIEHLRQERLVFANIHKKLIKQLATQKRDMAQLVERSNQAHQQRDEFQAKIVTLRERAEKETTQYDNEIKELTRTLEHDRKLKSFMGVKGQERAKEDMSQKRSAADEKTPEEMLRLYEAAFKKIKDLTGIEELDKQVDKFIEIEDTNFSLFNYVNELNREVERVREQIEQLQRQKVELTASSDTADEKRKLALQDLEGKLGQSQKDLAKLEEMHKGHEEELETLKEGVASIFGKIGCDPEAVRDKLGSSLVSEQNIMQYMRVIEGRANELLKMRGILDAKAEEDWEKREAEMRDQAQDTSASFDPTATLGPRPKPKSLLGSGPPPAAETELVQAPSTIEEDSDDDFTVDNKVLTPAELKAKVMQSTARGSAQGSARASSKSNSSLSKSRSFKKK